MSGRLLVISHTEHYQNPDGTVVGWPTTIREIDVLAELFDEVVHVGCLYRESAPAGMEAYHSGKVRFVAIPPFGGRGLKKFSVLWTAPVIIFTVLRQLRKADYFHFRAPTSMGVYVIPLLSIFAGQKAGWFKYAGNWIQKNPPLSYRWQRYYLKNLQKRKVTINGKWPDLPEHIVPFENPCLFESEWLEGNSILAAKDFKAPFVFCFIGRVDAAKGFDVVMDTLEKLPVGWVDELIVIGATTNAEGFSERMAKLPFKVRYLGFLTRSEVLRQLAGAHFLFLPSKSEGFPKVIAEAWSRGCLPIVTDVSAIGQYVHHEENGYTIAFENRHSAYLIPFMMEILQHNAHRKMAESGWRNAALFTYEKYRSRIPILVNSVNQS